MTALFLANPAAAAPTAQASPRAPSAAPARAASSFPATQPPALCGSTQLNNPNPPPTGPNVIVVPPGINNNISWRQPGKTFYFQTGVHQLYSDPSAPGAEFSQIDPADNETFIGATGAVLDGGRVSRYAFTTFPDHLASNVTVEYLTMQNFNAPGQEGVVNHDRGINWTITHNTVTHSGGAGVMIGSNNVVTFNCLTYNDQYGFSSLAPQGSTAPVTNITLDRNEIAFNNPSKTDPCGCTGAGKFWNVVGAAVTNNHIHDNHGPGIWADTNNAAFVIDGNYISNNDAEAIFYEISYNARITNNNILGNGWAKGQLFASQGNTYPQATIYISESGGDSRVTGGSTIDISGNNLANNWGGVELYENGDRYCSSSANTSAGWCTMVNPAGANLSSCSTLTANSAPALLSDCRWKTQNVAVHGNTFSFSRASVPCTTIGCGEQSLFGGDASSGSPYFGKGIDRAVTTQQNNHFYNNTYTGDWGYLWAMGGPGTFNQWQGSPESQDAGSTLNGATSPPSLPGNLVDADSANFEGSVGHWLPWFSDTIARTTAQAEQGRYSLQVNITGPYGWGIQEDNNVHPYFAGPGPQTVSFWGLGGTNSLGVGLVARLTAHWLRTDYSETGTTTATISALSHTWQRGTITGTAPADTAFVYLSAAAGSSGLDAGTGGDSLYLDQIFVGPTPSLTCAITGQNAGPPAQQQVTVQSGVGLESITSIQVTNGTIQVAPFTVGTTGPVLVTATKANQSQGTTWSFVATDVVGNTRTCT